MPRQGRRRAGKRARRVYELHDSMHTYVHVCALRNRAHATAERNYESSADRRCHVVRV